ncbi:MAG: thioredoxin family protein [bacterium]
MNNANNRSYRMVAGLIAAGVVAISATAFASEGAGTAKKMTAADAEKPPAAAAAIAAESALPQIGAKAPDFTLTDTDGKQHKLSDYTNAGKLVVIEWFNPDCPFIKKHHVKNNSMMELYTEQQKMKNVVWLAINSGAPGKQGAGLERNKAAKAEYKIEYPVLIDENGAVGKMYGAKTTPHMFVIAPDGNLIYKGAFDSDKSPEKVGDVVYVRTAVEQFAKGGKIEPAETASYGCSVKYAN